MRMHMPSVSFAFAPSAALASRRGVAQVKPTPCKKGHGAEIAQSDKENAK